MLYLNSIIWPNLIVEKSLVRINSDNKFELNQI